MKRLDYYYPSLGSSWLLFALLLAGQLIFGLGLAVLQAIWPNPLWTTTTLSYLLSMVFPLLFIFYMGSVQRRQGAPAVPLNRPDFGRMKGVPTFALAAVAMLSATVLIDPLGAVMPMPDWFKALMEKAFLNTTLTDSIIATCILAPLCEELIFRGMVQRGVTRSRGVKSGIFWSAFLFALVHMNPWQSIPAFILGLLFGWVYHRTGCLWLTIFLHCLNNSLSTLLSRVIPEMGVDSGFINLMPTGGYIALYAGAAVWLFLTLWLLRKYLPKPEAR